MPHLTKPLPEPDPEPPGAASPGLQIGENDLPGAYVGDRRTAVARDAAVLRAEIRLEGVPVSDLVYDVAAGLVEPIVQHRRT
jgi:hypothetical protein